MPCLAIHLAVAKKYLEKHNENKNEFILGTIAPDINLPDIDKYIKGTSEDKKSHHFGNSIETNSLIEYMKKKVNFNLFFSYNDINTSFAKAYFLHLLCDYYFFGDYIKDERLKDLSLRDAIKVGYNDYNLITRDKEILKSQSEELINELNAYKQNQNEIENKNKEITFNYEKLKDSYTKLYNDYNIFTNTNAKYVDDIQQFFSELIQQINSILGLNDSNNNSRELNEISLDNILKKKITSLINEYEKLNMKLKENQK